MRRPMILAVALAFVSILAVMASSTAAAWLSEGPRALGLVMLWTAVAASLLVLYFDWRAKLRRHVPGERGDNKTAA